MDTELLNRCEKKALEIAKIACEMMTNCSGQSNVDTKSTWADLVTETDRAIEKMVLDELKKEFPGHRFIGEESFDGKVNYTDEPTWICDPIDGTTNFVHTFPFCCISLALTYKKQIQYGLIYSPFLDKMYTAKLGCGAFCNGQRINVRQCESLNKALVITDFGSHRDDKNLSIVMRNMREVIQSVHGIRSLGSAALSICMVANGCVDAYYESGIHCWDMAAGALILTESGGHLFDPVDGEFDLMSRRILAAGQQKIGRELIGTLVEHVQLPRD